MVKVSTPFEPVRSVGFQYALDAGAGLGVGAVGAVGTLVAGVALRGAIAISGGAGARAAAMLLWGAALAPAMLTITSAGTPAPATFVVVMVNIAVLPGAYSPRSAVTPT